MTQVPRGLYGPEYDGMADPERITGEERTHRPLDAVVEERRRKLSPSPLIRRLQAAADRALGRRK